MDRIGFIKFMLIALALPTQYFLSEYWSNDSTQRTQALKQLFDGVNYIKNEVFNLESWKKWYMSFVIDIPESGSKKLYIDDQHKECVAVEVLNYRKSLKDFAESTKTRMSNKNVKYRIGQVVKHTKYDMYGVIVGWDYKANAPDEWVDANYKLDDREQLNQPHYLILVDSRFQSEFTHKSYVSQDEIEPVQNTKVDNKQLSAYFHSFNGIKYKKKQFLKIVYPND